MDRENLKSAIESILFAWAEPVSIEDFKKVFNLPKREILDAIEDLDRCLKKNDSGIRLVVLDNMYTLSTKPENGEWVKKFVKNLEQKNLSKPALETLSIIAYNQPVTKQEIEELRGVKSDGVIRGLLNLKLIEVSGKLDKIGKPNVYSTTVEFLKKFGIKNLEQLPQLEEKN